METFMCADIRRKERRQRRSTWSCSTILIASIWQDDVINRVPGLAARAAPVRKLLREKLVEHRRYIEQHGDDMPEIRDWKWPG
jgi:phosphoketolase